ncbi:DUF58 domain-containing protein [Populibacterium corticicola]
MTGEGNPSDSSPHAWHLPLVIVCAFLMLLAIMTGNPSLAFLALAGLVTTGFGYVARQSGTFHYRFAVRSATGRAEPNIAYATAILTPPEHGARAIVEVTFPGTTPLLLQVDVSRKRDIEFSVKTLRTGPRQQFGVRVLPLGPSGDWFGVWSQSTLPNTLVLAPTTVLTHIPTSTVTRGLTGPRTARRAGEGTEFRDLGPMNWGDSQRRIDWKASARDTSGLEQLQVRRTHAQSEATTIVIVDSRDEIGPEVITWGALNEIRADHHTSLDLARAAAVSIAQAAIASGDRVGFEDLARPRRPINPGTGPRHLQRIRHAISLTAPQGSVPERVRAPMVPSGSFVYLISTFLDDAPSTTALSLVAHGHQVIAVDVLPRLSLWELSDRQRLALRLVMVKRDARLRMVKGMGIDVMQWTSENVSRALAGRAISDRRKR